VTTGLESGKFWIPSKAEKLTQLLHHTKADLQDLGLLYVKNSEIFMDSNLSLETKKMNPHKKSSSKISSNLLPPMSQEPMDLENTYQTNPKFLKLRIKSNNLYYHIIKKWLRKCNLVYNTTMEYLKEQYEADQKFKAQMKLQAKQDKKAKKEKEKSTKPVDQESKKKKSKRKYKIRDKIKEKLKDDLINVPNTSVEYAIFDAYMAFKKTKNKTELKLKSINEVSQTMYIDGRSINDGYMYKINFKEELRSMFPFETDELNSELTDKEIKIEKAKYEKEIYKIYKESRLDTKNMKTNRCCIIQWNKQNGKIYLLKPIDCKNDKYENRKDIVSIDIGSNPFLAFYSTELCGKVNDKWINKIKTKFVKMDQTQSILATTKKRRDNFYERCELKRRMGRAREKVKNIVRNAHWQTINYFTKNYDTIILPKTNMKKIISTLPSKPARIIQTLSHYDFRQKMIHKCRERNVKLLLCKELFTSKTCSWCGNIKEDLGQAKVYNCVECKLTLDRDINGARNIMLRPLMLGLASPIEACVVDINGGTIVREKSINVQECLGN